LRLLPRSYVVVVGGPAAARTDVAHALAQALAPLPTLAPDDDVWRAGDIAAWTHERRAALRDDAAADVAILLLGKTLDIDRARGDPARAFVDALEGLRTSLVEAKSRIPDVPYWGRLAKAEDYVFYLPTPALVRRAYERYFARVFPDADTFEATCDALRCAGEALVLDRRRAVDGEYVYRMSMDALTTPAMESSEGPPQRPR
jgi:hypothetical protein